MIPWLLLFGVGGAVAVVASKAKAKRRVCTKPPCARKTTTTRPGKTKPGTKLEVTEPFVRHYFDKLIDRRDFDPPITRVVDWELKLLDLPPDVVKLRVEATIASTDDRPVVFLAGGEVANPGFGNVWSPVCGRYAIELDVAEVDSKTFVRHEVPAQMVATTMGGEDGEHCRAAMYGAENLFEFIVIETARNVDGNLLVRLLYRAWNTSGGRWIPGLLVAERPGGGLVWVEGHVDAVQPYRPA